MLAVILHKHLNCKFIHIIREAKHVKTLCADCLRLREEVDFFNAVAAGVINLLLISGIAAIYSSTLHTCPRQRI